MTLSLILAFFGLLLIYLEFFLPGGIMAIAGGGLLIGAIIYVLVSDVGPFALVVFIAAVIASLFFVIKLAIWQVRKTAKTGSVFLDSDQSGYMASCYNKELIGKIGVAESDLRPSGYITVEGKSFQAVTKGGFVTKGSKIQIIGGEGARLIIKVVKEE